MIGQYQIQKTLGEGSYGIVKLAKNEQNSEKVAIKISSASEIMKEFEVLNNLSHPNIISVKDVLKVPLSQRSKPTHERGLVMDYIQGGDLIGYIQKSGPLSEQTAMKFLLQILSALNHCHKNRYCHRDVKPDNILFDSKTGKLVLCDFGLATYCPPTRYLEGRVGSLLYCAPEVLYNIPYLGPQVDIWSAGVVFYCLLSGCVPWEGGEISEQLENAMTGNYYKLTHLSRDSEQLLSTMLCVNSERRPGAEQLMDRVSACLDKYNSPRAILFNESQYVDEDGAGSESEGLSADGESVHSQESTKATPKYNLRVVKESEMKKAPMYQLAELDMESLCKALEASFQDMNINFKTSNKKKSWMSGPSFKYQCKNERSRFDIEICTTTDEKSISKVLMCKNMKGDCSNAMSLLSKLSNKTQAVL